MRPVTKVRLAILGTIVVVGGGLLLKVYLTGAGMVHVMFPPDDIGSLEVDGHDTKPWDTRSRVRTYSVPQGTHQLTIKRPSGATRSTPITIPNGSVYMLTPLDEQQCFVLVDVTESQYRSAHGPNTLVQRLPEHQTLDLDGAPYMGFEGLPSSIPSGSRAVMVHDVACSMLKASDASILASLHQK